MIPTVRLHPAVHRTTDEHAPVQCLPGSSAKGTDDAEALEGMTEVGSLSRMLSEADDTQRSRIAERALRFFEQEYARGVPKLAAAVGCSARGPDGPDAGA